jgi:hypothetical protein
MNHDPRVMDLVAACLRQFPNCHLTRDELDSLAARILEVECKQSKSGAGASPSTATDSTIWALSTATPAPTVPVALLAAPSGSRAPSGTSAAGSP